jgi:hypothetical protein
MSWSGKGRFDLVLREIIRRPSRKICYEALGGGDILVCN